MRGSVLIGAGIWVILIVPWFGGALSTPSDQHVVSVVSEREIGDQPRVNPHGDWIFKVTDTQSCKDCHSFNQGGRPGVTILDNESVRRLIAKGKGAHGPGRFADCFRCHAGGRVNR